MKDSFEELVSSLLYEGYALYPYTPGITKNATPTPFGIIYPPAYAERSGSTLDHLQIECILEFGPEASVEAGCLFLQPSGLRHQALERRVSIPPTSVEALAGESLRFDFAFPIVSGGEEAAGGEAGGGEKVLDGRISLSARILRPGLARITIRVENLTQLDGNEAAAMDRPKALQISMISSHAFARAYGRGRFVSPLEHRRQVQACKNLNSFPVLATPDDDAVLGAAIMLPDHPQIAPESRLNFFDNTEIEEALVIHAQVLTDEELDELEHQDTAVKEMIASARGTTADELLNLHGRMRLTDPGEGFMVPAGSRPVTRPSRHQSEPPKPPPGYEAIPGLPGIEVDGRHFKRGDRVILHLLMSDRQDAIDMMLTGKTATIERILVDYENKVHFGVTIDDDPGQELLRETGRFMFFFLNEVELLPA